MKNLIIILSLLLTVFAAEAQLDNRETRTAVLRAEQNTDKYRQKLRDNHIRSVSSYIHKLDNKANADSGYLEETRKYDEQGNSIEYIWFNKRGKIKGHHISKYDEKSRCIEAASFKPNGKFFAKYTYNYDSLGNRTDYRFFWKTPNRWNLHSVSKYDERQNMLEQTNFFRNDSTVFTKYIYSYYPDGNKKQTVEYEWGKLKHTWNYDCKPAGSLVGQNLKDTSKVCIRYETDKNGNKIKIKEENCKQGCITRIIYKYDKNDNCLEITKYNKRGKVKYHEIAIYNENNQCTKYTLYVGGTNKVKKRYENHYDSAAFLTEEFVYKKNSQPSYLIKYIYKREQ